MKLSSVFAICLAYVYSPLALAVDDRGNTATQGTATWLRAAQYMVSKPKIVGGQLTFVAPIKIEVGHIMDPAAPQSPFAAPWSMTPNPTIFLGAAGVTLDPNLAAFGHAVNGEVISGDLGNQGTQMDALGHFGYLDNPGGTVKYFGGLTQSDVVGPNGLMRLGIEKAEPIVTSVVLLDAAKYLNGGNALPAGYTITVNEVDIMLSAEGLANRGIKEGDVVFIHTGYGAAWAGNPSSYYLQGPGLAHETSAFFASKRIVLVGLDNPFTDAAILTAGGPFPTQGSWVNGSNFWLPFGNHHQNLTQAGIHQIQNLNLTEMAQKKMYTAAVFILPIQFKGAAGSPVRPIVIGHPN